MRFHLEGRLVFSGDVSGAAALIGAAIEEANGTVLVKGAPEGRGARVVSWSVEGETLRVTIDSDEFVRADRKSVV